MAFIGLLFGGIVMIVLFAVISVVMLTAVILFIIGAIQFSKEKRRKKEYLAWAAASTTPVPPYKGKKYPVVFLAISLSILVPAVLYGIFTTVSSMGMMVKYKQDIAFCVEYEYFDSAKRLLENGASIDSTTSVVSITTDLMGKVSVIEHAPEIEQTAYGVFGDLLRVLDKLA